MKHIYCLLISITLLSIIIYYFISENETGTSIKNDILLKISFFKKPEVTKKYALMSANIDEKKNIFYYFYLPIVALAWKRLGFQPIVLLVKKKNSNITDIKNDNGPARKTIKYLTNVGVIVKFIETEKDYGLMTSMICRLFVGALDFLGKEDYVLTSDSDLVPIDSKYYEINEVEAITAWNSECCGTFIYKNRSYQMYPMGHIGMKKKHWKAVMNISSVKIKSEIIFDLLSTFFSKNLIKKDNEIRRGDATWNADQIILSQKINIYLYDFNKTKIVKKPYRGIRLDRSQSFATLIDLIDNKFSNLTDFHAFHYNFLERWVVTRKLLSRMFDKKTMNFFISYFNEFYESI